MTLCTIHLCHLALFSAVGMRGSPPAATHDAAQLRTQVAAAQARIKSFHAIYESHSYDDSFPAGNYLHCELAVKEPHVCSFLTAHGHDALPWSDDPMQSRICVLEREWVMEMPLNRCYFSQAWDADAPLPGSLREEIFINATGWYPMARRARASGNGGVTMLRDLDGNEAFSAVRPSLDAVDGRWCHVLESPGKEALWIDADRDYALTARESYDEEGALEYRFELTAHREVFPHVWAPGVIRTVSYNHNAREAKERQRIAAEGLIAVRQVTVNNVPDSELEWRPRPGHLWMNHPQAPRQIHPGGREHLDDLLHWIDKHGSPPEGHAGTVARHALAAIVVVLAFESCLRIRRARSSRSRQRTASGIAIKAQTSEPSRGEVA